MPNYAAEEPITGVVVYSIRPAFCLIQTDGFIQL